MESAGTTISRADRAGVTIAGRRVSQLWLDVALGVVLAFVGFLETSRNLNVAPGAPLSDWVFKVGPVVLIVLGGLSLSVRRYFPLAVMVLTVAALQSHDIDETGTGWLAMMIAAFSAGLQETNRRHVAIAFGLITAIVLGVWAVAIANQTADPIQPLMIGIVVAIWWVGDAMRQRAKDAAELQAHAIRLELEREHEAERAAIAERARIARELHDVIAHSLSVVVIQAAAAKRTLDSDPERAKESLDAVEQTGRSAMLEMRRLLGVVRRDELEASEDRAAAGAPRLPQPSLSEVRRLVDDMCDAGVDVALRVEGDERPLSPGVDVSGFRIVQEALTNAARHAPGAKTTVVMRFGENDVDITIENSGDGQPHAPPPDTTRPPGHGLAGMRERVSLLRGELEVGPRPAGGFAVHARLPIEDAEVGTR